MRHHILFITYELRKGVCFSQFFPPFCRSWFFTIFAYAFPPIAVSVRRHKNSEHSVHRELHTKCQCHTKDSFLCELRIFECIRNNIFGTYEIFCCVSEYSTIFQVYMNTQFYPMNAFINDRIRRYKIKKSPMESKLYSRRI